MTDFLHPATRHGKRRFKQRLGLPLRALRRMTEKALSEGLRLEDLPDPVRNATVSTRADHDPDGTTKVRVYRDHLFVFASNDVLITVYPFIETTTGDLPHKAPLKKVSYPRPRGRTAGYTVLDDKA